MQFISIGTKCNVKHQIDKWIGKQETLFFDWLATDMDSVISILSVANIRTLLNPDNIGLQVEHPYTSTRSRVLLKSLSYCLFVHDLRIQYNEADVATFINMYERRFLRIIQHIKSEKKLCFIRYGTMSDVHIELFIQTILSINSHCDFILVNVDVGCIPVVVKSKHFMRIVVTQPAKYDKNDWTTSYLNWEYVFNAIRA